MKEKYKQFFIEILPLIIGFLLQLFIHNEFLFTAIIIIILLTSLWIKYYQGERKLFFVGLIIGFIFEAMGGLVFRSQHRDNASLLGIPLWLPIFRGYGFIFIHRLGNLIMKK